MTRRKSHVLIAQSYFVIIQHDWRMNVR